MVFFTEYDNSSITMEYICIKPCLGMIISWSTKWMTGFILYAYSDTEHHKIMISYEFVVN